MFYSLISCSPDESNSHQTIRNVLLISIDTCRSDHLSCYGDPRNTTPHIDRLAQDGIRFAHAVSPVPLTLPAHSSMLTGTNPTYHGVHDNSYYQLSDGNVTLAEMLKEHGFTTGAMISSFVLDSQFGLNQGFDTYHDYFEDPRKGPGDISERIGTETSRLAMQWLDEHGSRKFFLFLHYYDPHAAYAPPDSFASQFVDDRYAGEIAYVDHCIGQVLDKLITLGIDDSTLIIITSDHGEMLGEHGEDTHSYFIYQSAIRVPLIFKVPGRHETATLAPVAGIIDVVPTICGLLGIESPPHIQGIDLSKHFVPQNSATQPRYLYCESLYPTRYQANPLLGLVTDRWKYIQTTRPELYDLLRDPSESTNLASIEPLQIMKFQRQLNQMIEQQLDANTAGANLAIDPQARHRLETLGYLAGSNVDERFELDPDQEDPKDLIAFYKSHMLIFSLLSNEKIEEAKRLCKQLVAKRPEFWEGYIHLGNIAMSQKDYATAISYLQRSIELKPDLDVAHNNLGNAFQALGKFAEAIEHFHKALQIRPNHVEALNNLANALQLQGELDEAISYYHRVLGMKPTSAEAHSNLGSALRTKGQLDDAIHHYREALKLNSQHSEAQNNLANALRAQGKPQEAIAYYRKAIKTNPDHAGSHNNFGIALAAQGNLDEAIKHYRLTIELDPNHAAAHNNLGRALAAQKRLDEATDHYRQAIRIDPDYGIARNNLGNALIAQSRFDEAIRQFRGAVRVNPDYFYAYNNLGNALAKQQRFGEAIVNYRQALRINPDYYKAYNNLGLALASVGRLDDAIEQFHKALNIHPDYASAKRHLDMVEKLKKSQTASP